MVSYIQSLKCMFADMWALHHFQQERLTETQALHKTTYIKANQATIGESFGAVLL